MTSTAQKRRAKGEPDPKRDFTPIALTTGGTFTMLKKDVEQTTLGSCLLPTADSLPAEVDDYEIVKVLVISSRKGVNATIHTLYALKFAQISEWSPLLPAPTSGEVMSILTKRIRC